MRFILWTFVWFMMEEIQNVLRFGFPYNVGYSSNLDRYSDGVSFLAITTYLVLWIFLYVKFIRTEQ